MKVQYSNKLNSDEKEIMLEGKTEIPFSGEYNNFSVDGTYVCKACELVLFDSNCKFNSGCGWPSFDHAIEGTVERRRDCSLGRIRTEIICSNCKGHLGHVFTGEKYTVKNTRYCVNSLSLKFKPR
mgnify:CR=1 FL=1